MAKGLTKAFTTESGLDAPEAFWIVSSTSFDHVSKRGEIYLLAYKNRRAAKLGLQPLGTRQYSLGPKEYDQLQALKIAEALPGGKYSTATYGRIQEAAILTFLRQLADVLVSPEERDPETNTITKPAIYESFFKGALEADEE